MNIKKIIFIISITLNISLIFLSFLIYNKINDGKESAANEIQHQLIALEKAIGEEMEASWSKPENVDKQFKVSLETMNRSLDLIDELSIGRKKEYDLTWSFLKTLEAYKRNDFYKNNKFTSQGIENLEKLRSLLRDEGFGNGISITMNDYEEFISKIDSLNKKTSN